MLVNQKQRPLYIKLNEGNLPFYTSGDFVRGVVRVDPSVRPQNINITFKGQCVLFDESRNGLTPTFFEYSQKLFVAAGAQDFDILRQGTSEDGKVELPFQFTFPLTVSSAPPADGTWLYANDSPDHPRFQHSPGFPLPPVRNVYVRTACETNTDFVRIFRAAQLLPPAMGPWLQG
jgi:hypothetical protein